MTQSTSSMTATSSAARTDAESSPTGAAHGGDELPAVPPPPHYRWYQIVPVLLLLVAMVAGLFLAGMIPRVNRQKALAAEAERVRNERPRVMVAHPRAEAPSTEVLLPGDVRPMEETVIHARTEGYVSRWTADIGDVVQQGTLLVELSTPEIDQQLREAEAEVTRLHAELRRVQAEAKLAELTWERYRTLRDRDATTQQELDQSLAEKDAAAAAVRSSEAAIRSAEARVERTGQLLSFSRITAPFSGTITSRSVEVGQLVTTGNGNGQKLYTLARTDPVRVLIDVPQVYASGVKIGARATILVRELPDREFVGTVTRTAGALDPSTRTLRVEVQVPNNERLLLTGAYVQVRLEVTRSAPRWLLPATALMFNADGTRLAIVDETGHVRFRDVEVAGEFDTEVGLASGVGAEDRVITNPGEYLSDGMEVEPVETDLEPEAPRS